MSAQKSSQLIAQLEWRYAVKKFDPGKKIPESDWSALEKSLVLTPSSYGLQPWKFLVVQDPGLRAKLRAASWNQSQVTDCSHFVVFARRTHLDEAYIRHYIKRVAEVRGQEEASLKGYHDMMVNNLVKGPQNSRIEEWAAHQTYIALGNFMTSAALIGIDTCPMEGLDPKQYDEILGLKGGAYGALVVCAAGYRHPDDGMSKLKKVRFDTQEIVKYL